MNMLINEVSKSTGLTKKAIEYYTMQELVTPKILENGYRDYSQKDIEVLNKISILRKLDISTEDIKNILSDESGNTLKTLAVRKELSYQREQAKKKILNKLSSGKSYSEVNKELLTVENNKTITEKLLDAFPGYYGRYICLHFSSFWMNQLLPDRQQLAYERIISFLDNVPSLELSEELKGVSIRSYE